MELNILVFPCGSEIGLEIHRSLKYSRHINLVGGNSVDDHGKYVFKNYIGNLPFFNDDHFVSEINKVIEEYKIDAIYPAMDAVISRFSEIGSQINCKILGSADETNHLCLSKQKTYQALSSQIECPEIYSLNELDDTVFPLFMKPAVGYGSRGAIKVHTITEVEKQLLKYPDSLILEYLPGPELTVDCFTDRHGKLRFWGPRGRNRISNGISVNTSRFEERGEEIYEIVEKINHTISFRGAWFVQLKMNEQGQLSLLEIAARFGGSSGLYRNVGINFALLSVFDAFDFDVEIIQNNYSIELDRALNNKYKLHVEYDTVYCDFDDCLIIRDQLNTELLSFLYQCVNKGKKIILITKHEKDLNRSLQHYRLSSLFDEIIHLKKESHKFQYMDSKRCIFIDDSHEERKNVFEQLKIPVFAPDSIEALLD